MANQLGWSSLESLDKPPMGLALRADTLVVESGGVWSTVRLQDVKYVEVKESNPGGTALIVLGSVALVGVAAAAFVAECHGCLYMGQAR